MSAVALLYVKAPVIAEAVHLIGHLMKEHLASPEMAEAVHLVGHLMKEHLASPEMAVLHVLEALEPKLNITQRLTDSLRNLDSSRN